jgi:hypothetical protein
MFREQALLNQNTIQQRRELMLTEQFFDPYRGFETSSIDS